MSLVYFCFRQISISDYVKQAAKFVQNKMAPSKQVLLRPKFEYFIGNSNRTVPRGSVLF